MQIRNRSPRRLGEDDRLGAVQIARRDADGWAAPVTYASLQVLEQAIEKAGTLDRKKVLEAIANGGPWDTVSGPIDL